MPMNLLQTNYEIQLKEFNDISTLASFLDNHDVKRIAHELKTLPDDEIVATVISMLTYTHLA
jgi:hypothetical protein